MHGNKYALALNDDKVSLVEIGNNQVIGNLQQQSEDITTFAVSPNQQILATGNKNGLVRIFQLPDLSVEPEAFKRMECSKVFKLTNQLVVQMTFDPTSKFLAVGTSDSHIKIFDIKGGF